MPENPSRSKREARRHHAEHKGGKLEGSQQQRTIKEFLTKIKSQKNSLEKPRSQQNLPNGRGFQDANRGVSQRGRVQATIQRFEDMNVGSKQRVDQEIGGIT